MLLLRFQWPRLLGGKQTRWNEDTAHRSWPARPCSSPRSSPRSSPCWRAVTQLSRGRPLRAGGGLRGAAPTAFRTAGKHAADGPPGQRFAAWPPLAHHRVGRALGSAQRCGPGRPWPVLGKRRLGVDSVRYDRSASLLPATARNSSAVSHSTTASPTRASCSALMERTRASSRRAVWAPNRREARRSSKTARPSARPCSSPRSSPCSSPRYRWPSAHSA